MSRPPFGRPPLVFASGTAEYGPHDPHCVAALLGARPGLPCAEGEVQILPRAAAQAKPRRGAAPTPTPAVQEALGVVPWVFLPDRPWPDATAYRLVGLRLYSGDEVEPDRPHAVWTWAPEEMGERVSEELRVELNAETRRRAEAMMARVPQMLPDSRDAAAVRLHRLADDPLGALGFWVTPRGLLRARDDDAPKTVRPRPDKDYRAMSLVVDLSAVKIPGLPGGRASVGFSRALANLASALCGSVSVVEVTTRRACSLTRASSASFGSVGVADAAPPPALASPASPTILARTTRATTPPKPKKLAKPKKPKRPKKPPKPAPSDIRAEVLRLHAEGLTSTVIARSVGRGDARVSQILKENGLTHNKPAPREVRAEVLRLHAEVLRLHTEGLTNAAIAARVGRSNGRVSQIVKNEGLTHNKPAPQGVRAEVLRLHAIGFHNHAIAQYVGRSHQRVSKILKEEGLTCNPYSARQLDADVVVAMYEEGLTDADIGRELGFSQDWVGQIRKRAGVKGRAGGPPPKLSPAEIGRLLTLARQGWRQVDLAAEFDLAQGCVSRIMRKHGIERQPARHRRVKP